MGQGNGLRPAALLVSASGSGGPSGPPLRLFVSALWLSDRGGQPPGPGSVLDEFADGSLVLVAVAVGQGILARFRCPIVVLSPRPGKFGYGRHGRLYGEWFDLAAQLAQAKFVDSPVAFEELFVKVTASLIGSHDQKVRLAAEAAQQGQELTNVYLQLCQRSGLRLINHGECQPAIVEPKQEVLPQVGLAAALRQDAQRAAREIGENRNLFVVIQHKLRWPGPGFQVEMHSQQPCLNDRECMAAAAAGIVPQQASGGLGDLEDDRILRDPPQEPKPLQRL